MALVNRMYSFLHRYMPGLSDDIARLYKKIRNDGNKGNDDGYNNVPPYVQNPLYYDKVFLKTGNDIIDPERMNIAFVIPQPIEGSGGHRNFYRAIYYLHQFGHDVTVYYTQTFERADEVKDKVSKWFYDMSDIPFICYDGDLGYHDVVIATWWETVYMVKKNINKVKFPFYFVQDFEPAFYPVCSNYILAENTYNQKFSHICSGKWCKDFLINKYHAEAEYFQFPVNKEIYNTKKTRVKDNTNIIFFAKPEMDRRCYEIGIMALKEVKLKRPDIEIILFGSNHVKQESIPFPVTIKKLLPTLEDLANLYRNADLGVVFSTTNPSLVPFEMMSCGCPVVDLRLDGAALKYGGTEDNVFLCSPEPEIMADEILKIMGNQELIVSKRENGKKWVDEEFPSELEMARRIEKMIINKVTTGKMDI